MVNEQPALKVKYAKTNEAYEQQGMDYRRAFSNFLGERPDYNQEQAVSQLFNNKKSSRLGEDFFMEVIEILTKEDPSEDTVSCDVERLITEKIDNNFNKSLATTYNVAGIPEFSKRGISAIVAVNLLGKQQTDGPIIVTLKIIPEGYERDRKQYTEADIVIEAPSIKQRSSHQHQGDYWKSVRRITDKIMQVANQKNKKYKSQERIVNSSGQTVIRRRR